MERGVDGVAVPDPVLEPERRRRDEADAERGGEAGERAEARRPARSPATDRDQSPARRPSTTAATGMSMSRPVSLLIAPPASITAVSAMTSARGSFRARRSSRKSGTVNSAAM